MHYRKRRGAKGYGRASNLRIRYPLFPDRVFIKLNYAERINATSTSGGISQYLFRGNSLFDPNFSGTGHQPYGYDQWANMYSSYRVHGSKFTVKLLPITDTNPEIQAAGLMDAVLVAFSGINTLSYVSIDQARESPYNRHTLLNRNGSRQGYLKMYMSTAKMYGVSKVNIQANDAYAAGTGANPGNQFQWILIVKSADNLVTITALADVKITYYCELYNRISVNQS